MNNSDATHYTPEVLLQILADLAEATGRSTTRTALARRLAEALSHYLPLQGLELGWVDTERGDVELIVVSDDKLDLQLRRVSLKNRLAGLAMATRTAQTQHIKTPHHRLEVALPLLAEAGEAGYLELHLDAHFPPGVLLDTAFLGPMSRILTGGQHTVRLIERVARVSKRAHRRNQELRKQLERYTLTEGVVAVSERMRTILEQIELIAAHDSTVLLRGESGTGKELLARTIHRMSPRSGGAFIQVNCGALPEGLVESELFGHEQGAFTGATNRHIGRFERASGGTILLDEVAELPQAVQVKLLRVLQERTLERVGGEEMIKVDVRVIAATHRDLEAMVAEGLFRADLYYRINVFPIHIPPLRERAEDIPVLAEVLLDTIAKRLGHEQSPELTKHMVAQLCAYPWPGNVRELENVLERAVILSPDSTLRIPTLASPVAQTQGAIPQFWQEPLTFDEGVRRVIESALKVTEGRIYGQNGAAQRLGLKPSTLQSKMKRLGIKRGRFI